MSGGVLACGRMGVRSSFHYACSLILPLFPSPTLPLTPRPNAHAPRRALRHARRSHHPPRHRRRRRDPCPVQRGNGGGDGGQDARPQHGAGRRAGRVRQARAGVLPRRRAGRYDCRVVHDHDGMERLAQRELLVDPECLRAACGATCGHLHGATPRGATTGPRRRRRVRAPALRGTRQRGGPAAYKELGMDAPPYRMYEEML